MKTRLGILIATLLSATVLISLLLLLQQHNQKLKMRLLNAQQATTAAEARAQQVQQTLNQYVANAEQISADVHAALNRHAAIHQQLQKVYQDDVQAKDWADQPVPAGISRLFQQPPTAAD